MPADLLAGLKLVVESGTGLQAVLIAANTVLWWKVIDAIGSIVVVSILAATSCHIVSKLVTKM